MSMFALFLLNSGPGVDKMKHKQKSKRKTNDDLPDAEFSGCLSRNNRAAKNLDIWRNHTENE